MAQAHSTHAGARMAYRSNWIRIAVAEEIVQFRRSYAPIFIVLASLLFENEFFRVSCALDNAAS